VKHISKEDDTITLHEACVELGKPLRHGLDLPIPLDPLNEMQSEFFKIVYQNPSRTTQQFIDRED
jgi:hypothetical protein